MDRTLEDGILPPLAEEGFTIAEKKIEGEAARWVRTTRWNEDFRLFISLLPIIETNTYSEYSATLGVESPLVDRIERDAGLWKCIDRMRGLTECPLLHPLSVISVALAYLINSHRGEIKKTFELISLRREPEYDVFFEALRSYALPFLYSLDELEGFSSVITRLEELSHIKGPVGFYSDDAVCYHAIALHYSGKPTDATRVLDDALEGRVPQSLVSGIAKEGHGRDTLSCRIRALKNYLSVPR